ncbi:hypothetical protein [Snodgrassella sp. CFCC 13594]|uniref:hypothetical protein n=1 Tax=Snodgrassella sp. CFCC 13594 TaxID=1775559 RepID=UPI00083680CA|nr:hypothetical protein [Snodgrassella sp. CFCC 13594]
MWWILLFLLMLAIAALLWWRGKQEREWRMELTYLSRHQKEDDAQGAQLQTPAPTLRKVSPVLTNMREQVQNQQHHQALSERLQAKMRALNPRHKQAPILSDEDKQRLASDEALAELPIFAQSYESESLSQAEIATTAPAEDAQSGSAAADGITVTSPLKHMHATPKASIADTPAESVVSGSLNESDGHHPMVADVPAFAPVLDEQLPAGRPFLSPTNLTPENTVLAQSALQTYGTPTQLPETEAPLAAIGQNEHSASEKTSIPATHWEVITLAEATRKVATLVKADDTPTTKAPLETVKLNWPLPEVVRQPEEPIKPEITLADPALSRIRSRTEAERLALREAQTDPAMMVVPPSHTIRHESHTDESVHTIGAEDIRSNLLRQRLARRRTEPVTLKTAGVELSVIAEDEVLANLSKTDSPVNKHKFRRTTVRESVIPAAARIGQSHAVNVSPVAAAFSQAALPTAAVSAPISTRFTPFDHQLSGAETGINSAAALPSGVGAAMGHRLPEKEAAPVLHMTDAPQWSIHDRLQQPSPIDWVEETQANSDGLDVMPPC